MKDTIEERLDEILATHRSETWNTGWNNDATEKAKAALTLLITKAKIETLEIVEQRVIGKNASGDRVFYDKDGVIAENKVKDWQRNILEHMKLELKATTQKEGNHDN